MQLAAVGTGGDIGEGYYLVDAVCETWKLPSQERVLVFTVFGETSVSCWARYGKRVSPQHGATETSVGAEVEKARRERRESAVVVARMIKIELPRVKI